MTALAFGGLYGWTTAWVLGGFVAFAVALPAFLWVESHKAEPLLDLSLFRIRLFAMGNLTSLLNGIARNGVLFLLVFYLQGAKGDDPVTAGILLAPLAIGLLVLSPISGALADRYGSRLLATAGMLVTALGLHRPDHDPGRHAVLAARAVAADHRRRVGAVRPAPTPAP